MGQVANQTKTTQQNQPRATTGSGASITKGHTMKPNPNWRGDPTFLPEALKHFGVKVQEWPGWRNRGHGDFQTIQGIIAHHTGTNTDIPGYIAQHPQLGLCSQIHLNRDGTAVITGAGIAWHAGRGSAPGWPTNNANAVSIGIEAASDGVSPWPATQLDAYYRTCAAILWFLGKRATKTTLISHWEYSQKAQGKWDPGAGNGRSGAVMNMDVFRAEVNKRIDAHDTPAKPTPAAPASLYTQITTFIKGFVGPIGSDVKDIRQQLTGGRDKGEYPGWPQLGRNAEGKALTLVDAVAALRRDVAALTEIMKEKHK